jgi:hypothetical protein
MNATDIEIIKCMINNSTWKSPEKNIVYKFNNNKELLINGNNHLQYSLKTNNEKIELQIGHEKKYEIEYINDFVLKLHNGIESFRIMPD